MTTAFSSTAPDIRARLVAIVFTGLLGAFLLLGAAFVPIPAVHDAAHDARHALAFPCH